MNSSQIKKTKLEHLIPLITDELSAGRSVCFSPSGKSMLPMLREGIDFVVLSPVPDKLKKYDLPLYRRDSGQYILHRIIKSSDTYSCIGDNQYYKETGLRHDQMIALVTSFSHNGKDISVNNFGYRVYCRFWHYSRPIRWFFTKVFCWLWRHIKK